MTENLMEQDKFIRTITEAIKAKGLTFSDVILAASNSHLQQIDNIYRTNVTDEAKYIISIDDVPLSDDAYVLIKDQSDSRQNGIYLAHYPPSASLQPSSTPSTSPSFLLKKIDQDYDNFECFLVKYGTTNANTVWITKKDPTHPDNINFILNNEKITRKDNPLQSPLQQSLYLDSYPLSIFNSIVSIIDDLYVFGNSNINNVITNQIILGNNSTNLSKATATKFTTTENSTTINFPSTLDFVCGSDASPNLSLSKSSVSVTNSFQCLGPASFMSNVDVNGSFSLDGNLYIRNGEFITSFLHINSQTDMFPTFDLQNFGRIVLMGDVSARNGPHITTFTQSDEFPLLNISSWSHDDISINFDCYYDGASCTPSSFTAAQLRKHRNQLQFNYYDNLTNGFISAFSIDLINGSIIYSNPNTVFSNTEGKTGSIKILPSQSSNEASIALYTSNSVSNENSGFWKLSVNKKNDAFSIVQGNDTPFVTFDKNRSITFSKDCELHFPGKSIFKGKVSIKDPLYVDDALTVQTFSVLSGSDVSDNGSAAAVINGGVQIGKSLIVNNGIVSSKLFLSSQKPRIIFDASEDAGPPILNSNSPGSRIILSKNLSPATTNAAIGVFTDGSVWYSIPADFQNYSHNWYAGVIKRMSLDGAGNFSLYGSGSKAEFKGFSRGIVISGLDIDDSAYVQYGDNWRLGKNFSGEFELTTGNEFNSAVLTITNISNNLQIHKDLNVTGNLSVNKSILCEKLNLSSGNDHVIFTQKGITYSGNDILTFPSKSSDLGLSTGNNTPLDLNGQKIPLATTRSSDTHVNRNNSGNFTVWKGGKKMFNVDDNGSRFANGSVLVDSGNIDVIEGNLSLANGKLWSNYTFSKHGLSIGTHNVDNIDDNVSHQLQQPHLYIKNENTTLLFATSDTDNTINSNASLTLHSDHNMTISAKNTISWKSSRVEIDNVSVKGKMTHASNYIANFVTREGRLKNLSHNEKFYVENIDVEHVGDVEHEVWYYLGRLNTSISAKGTDECGHISLRLFGTRVNRTQTQQQQSESIDFTADVVSGNIIASHSLSTKKDAERNLDIYVFRNQDIQDAYNGDLHLFFKIKGNFIATLNVKEYLTGKNSIYIYEEGRKQFPNGKMSGFGMGTGGTGSWKRVYSTETATPSTNRSIGNLDISENLVVEKKSIFNGNVQARKGLQIDGNVVANNGVRINGSLHLQNLVFNGDDASSLPSISLTGNFIKVNKSIIPTSSTQLGNLENSFSALHVETVAAKNVQSTHLQSKNATIEDFSSKKVVSDDLIVRGNSTFDDVYIKGNLVTDYDLKSSNAAFNNVKTTHIESTEGINVSSTSGFVTFFGENGYVNGKLSIDSNSTTRLESKKLELNTTLDKISISADGHVSSTSHLFLSPNQDTSIALMQNGDVIINHPELTHRTTSRFIVNSQETTISNLAHLDDVVINGSCMISQGKLDLGQDASVSRDVNNNVVFATNGSKLRFDTVGNIYIDGDVYATKAHCESISTKTVDVEKLNIGDVGGVKNEDETLVFRGKQGIKLSSASSFSTTFIDMHVSIKDGLIIGKDTNTQSKGIILCGNSKTNGITIQGDDGNDSNVFRNAKNLHMENSGGDVVINAAGNRGMVISGISGNIRCNGTVVVESALDMNSTGTFDKTAAALTLDGGMMAKGHVLTDKGVILFNDATGKRISLVTPEDLEDDYTFTLPSIKPPTDGCTLVSTGQGKLTWQPPLPVEKEDDKVIVQPVENQDNGEYNGEYNDGIITAGREVSSGGNFGLDTAFVKLKSCTYKGTKRVSEMDGKKQWNAVHLSQPFLDMSEGYLDESDEYVASTLFIEDAPKSEHAKQRYAFNVKSGTTLFEDPHDSIDISDAAVVIKGGLSVKKVVRCDSQILTSSLKIGDDGTLIKNFIFGKHTVGASDEKIVKTFIKFDKMMSDVDYVIVGSVVTAGDKNAIFACSFNSLTKEGCTANICRLDGDKWDDITTTLHYYVTSTF